MARRRNRGVVVGAVLLGMSGLWPVMGAPAAAAPPEASACLDCTTQTSVHANAGGFVGERALFFPGEGLVRGADGSGNCDGCEWQLKAFCQFGYAGDAETFATESSNCGSSSARCFVGDEEGLDYFVLFRSRENPEWTMRDRVCQVGPGPLRESDLARAVVRRFQELVPRPQPGRQPGGPALIRKPVIFYAGQPSSMARSVNVLGAPVQIRARADYEWSFGDGSSESFAVPGGPYPNMDVTHTYTDPGAYTARLTTTWRGTYRLPGDSADRPIPGTVVQTAPPLRLRLVESAPQLVAPD